MHATRKGESCVGFERGAEGGVLETMMVGDVSFCPLWAPEGVGAVRWVMVGGGVVDDRAR